MALVGAEQRRMVLYPYGPPRRARHREICDELVVSLGGDVARIIDAPTVTLDRFIGYIGRIAVLREGEEAIVLLHRTNPLALAVVNARRRMEGALPKLRDSRWLLFVDLDDDPAFVESARQLGTFETGDMLPAWIGPEATRYDLFAPDVESLRAAIAGASGASAAFPRARRAIDPRAEPSGAPPPLPSEPPWDEVGRASTPVVRRQEDPSASRATPRALREPVPRRDRSRR